MLKIIENCGQAMFGPGFSIPDFDRPVVFRLLAYFLKDQAVAEADGIDLKKGIMLIGPVGCGKTSLMRIIQELSPPNYKPAIVSCRDVSVAFSQKGYEVIEKYSKQAFYPYTNTPRVHCFDDLGLEPTTSFWGNTCHVMAEVLLSRYDMLYSHGMVTHITTNLNTEELEECYGNRLRSRMREMFNLMAYHPGSEDKRR